MLDQCNGNPSFVIIMLRLVFTSVYLLHITDASSAFVVVYPTPTTTTFSRFLPVRRKLPTARRRSEITTGTHITTNALKNVLASSSLNFSSSSENTATNQREKVELWLDLRGTKVTPHAALMHIIRELRDDPLTEDENASRSSDILANKVIISANDRTGSNIIDEQQMYMVNEALREGEGVINEIGDEREIQTEIIFTSVDKDKNSVNLCCHRRSDNEKYDSIITIGEVMNNPSGASSSYTGDPIQGLEVVSRGEWVFLDVSQDERSESVQSLFELVSSAGSASLSSFSLGDGKIGAIHDETLHVDDTSFRLGGIAIGCSTNADILKIAGCIQSLATSGGKGGYTTESGIYIQVPSDENDEYDISKNDDTIYPSPSSSRISRPNENTEKDSKIRYAIVIPFDTALWKSAALLFR